MRDCINTSVENDALVDLPELLGVRLQGLDLALQLLFPEICRLYNYNYTSEPALDTIKVVSTLLVPSTSWTTSPTSSAYLTPESAMAPAKLAAWFRVIKRRYRPWGRS